MWLYRDAQLAHVEQRPHAECYISTGTHWFGFIDHYYLTIIDVGAKGSVRGFNIELWGIGWKLAPV
jgi:hypothetical protein